MDAKTNRKYFYVDYKDIMAYLGLENAVIRSEQDHLLYLELVEGDTVINFYNIIETRNNLQLKEGMIDAKHTYETKIRSITLTPEELVQCLIDLGMELDENCYILRDITSYTMDKYVCFTFVSKEFVELFGE